MTSKWRKSFERMLWLLWQCNLYFNCLFTSFFTAMLTSQSILFAEFIWNFWSNKKLRIGAKMQWKVFFWVMMENLQNGENIVDYLWKCKILEKFTIVLLQSHFSLKLKKIIKFFHSVNHQTSFFIAPNKTS